MATLYPSGTEIHVNSHPSSAAAAVLYRPDQSIHSIFCCCCCALQTSWYCKNINRAEAEHLLRQEGKDGGFVVRSSSQPSSYTVSVYTHSSGKGEVRHYQIKQTDTAQFFLAENHVFGSIPELINYHRHNAADKWKENI
ncbi:hypothetical protein cypCar_00043398 [Cyprinus carpio]|nr:hypothetical protein cypCar_00043398 [Cyprinus carpio]